MPSLHPGTPHHVLRLRREALWAWPHLVALLITIPAFYLSLNASITHWPGVLYGVSCVVIGLRLVHLFATGQRNWVRVKEHST